MPGLEIGGPLSAGPQRVTDEFGTASSLVISTRSVGVGAPQPEAALEVNGDLLLERTGSPRVTLYSRGNGTQRYSIRATNDNDPAGGRLLVIRNESRNSDDLVLDNRGDLKLEHSGSPKLTLYSVWERHAALQHPGDERHRSRWRSAACHPQRVAQ